MLWTRAYSGYLVTLNLVLFVTPQLGPNPGSNQLSCISGDVCLWPLGGAKRQRWTHAPLCSAFHSKGKQTRFRQTSPLMNDLHTDGSGEKERKVSSCWAQINTNTCLPLKWEESCQRGHSHVDTQTSARIHEIWFLLLKCGRVCVCFHLDLWKDWLVLCLVLLLYSVGTLPSKGNTINITHINPQVYPLPI